MPKAQREDHHRSLPVPMRQLIVDLKAQYPDFTDVARSPVFVRFSLRDDDQVNIWSRLS
jgi:hypothetical protein